MSLRVPRLHFRRERLEFQLTDVYITVMLLVFPLFTGLQGYSNLTLSKYRFFMYATLLWAGLLILVLAWNRVKEHHSSGRLGVTDWAILAFFLAALLSAIASPYKDAVLRGAGRYDGLVTLLAYTLIFIGISLTGKIRKKYLFCLVCSQCICCIIALIQLLGYNPLWLFPQNLCYYDAHIQYTGEFLGTIGNANLLSAFLTITIPLFVGTYVTNLCGEKRGWIFLSAAGLGTCVLIASGVAGGIVALGLCTLIAMPLLLNSRQRVLRALWAATVLCLFAVPALAFSASYTDGVVSWTFCFTALPALFAVAGAIACFLFRELLGGLKRFPSPHVLRLLFLGLDLIIVITVLLAALFWPGESGTLYELGCLLRGQINDRFGSSRILIWKEVLALFPEAPLLGGGPDTLALRLDIQFTRYVPETGKTLATFVDNAHNEYLGYLANLGLLGLATYVIAQLICIRRWIKTSNTSIWLPTVGCALLCYWIQSFFGLGMCIVAPVMWIVWGLFSSESKNMRSISKETSF
jgi:O-antigen ligase